MHEAFYLQRTRFELEAGLWQSEGAGWLARRSNWRSGIASTWQGIREIARETVFNYPTLTECYKVPAFDGINRHL